MQRIVRNTGHYKILMLEVGGGVTSPMTKEEILAILGPASATNDGYLTKEDWSFFYAGGGGEVGGQFIDIDMGSFITPNQLLDIDMGQLVTVLP
jgi:hypothetical protein